MMIAFALAFAGLLFVYCEFFMPGGILAVGGALLLLGSIGVFLYKVPGLVAAFAYVFSLGVLLFLLSKVALRQIKKRKNHLFLVADQEGYLATEFNVELIGKEGSCLSDLKPAGLVAIEGERLHAISEEGFTEQGTSVYVAGGKGSYLIVRRKEKC